MSLHAKNFKKSRFQYFIKLEKSDFFGKFGTIFDQNFQSKRFPPKHYLSQFQIYLPL